MPVFVPPELLAHSTWREARSALPDAPVVSDEPVRRRLRYRPRARLGGTLRALARVELRLAERLDPADPCGRPARAG